MTLKNLLLLYCHQFYDSTVNSSISELPHASNYQTCSIWKTIIKLFQETILATNEFLNNLNFMNFLNKMISAIT
jgi:hypothetical protein